MNWKGKCGGRELIEEEAIVMIWVRGKGLTKVKAVKKEEDERIQEDFKEWWLGDLQDNCQTTLA